MPAFKAEFGKRLSLLLLLCSPSLPSRSEDNRISRCGYGKSYRIRALHALSIYYTRAPNLWFRYKYRLRERLYLQQLLVPDSYIVVVIISDGGMCTSCSKMFKTPPRDAGHSARQLTAHIYPNGVQDLNWTICKTAHVLSYMTNMDSCVPQEKNMGIPCRGGAVAQWSKRIAPVGCKFGGSNPGINKMAPFFFCLFCVVLRRRKRRA